MSEPKEPSVENYARWAEGISTGCSNHGCLVRESQPGGVGTNAICQCLRRGPTAQRIMRRMADALERLQSENSWLYGAGKALEADLRERAQRAESERDGLAASLDRSRDLGARSIIQRDRAVAIVRRYFNVDSWGPGDDAAFETDAQALIREIEGGRK